MILLIVGLSIEWLILDGILPLAITDDKDDIKNVYALIYIAISVLPIASLIKFYLVSQLQELVLMYEDRIVFKAKNKADKQFSYQQVSEAIRKDGLKINKGFIEIKLDDCKLKLEVLAKDHGYLDLLLEFLAEKTGIEMPVLFDKDKLLIQRTKCLKLWFKIYFWCLIGDLYICSILAFTPSKDNLSYLEKMGNFFVSYIPFSSVFVNFFDYHMLEAVTFFFGLLLIPAYFINISPFKKRFSDDKFLRIK